MKNQPKLDNIGPVLKPEGAPVFDEGKYTVLLPIAEKVFDFTRIHEVAEKEGFEKKDTFHITIVGFRHVPPGTRPPVSERCDGSPARWTSGST